MKNPIQPRSYRYVVSPMPRPVSTASLGEVFAWFFKGNYLPPDPQVHPLAARSRLDPNYTIHYPDGTCASEREVGHTLYVLCRLLRPHNVIEVGCYHGATSICLAAALKTNGLGHLYCVDKDRNSVEFTRRNLEAAKLSEKTTLILGYSTRNKVLTSIPQASLILIDGDHTYTGVRKDFLAYQRKLTPTGIMVLHDSVKIMAIRRLIAEIAEEGIYEIFTCATSDGDGMSLLRKVKAT